MALIVTTVLLGVLAAALAVFGGLVSSDNPTHKKWFITLGIASVVVVLAQGWFLYQDKRENDAKQDAIATEAIRKQQEVQSKLDNALFSQEFMKGQLSGLSLMVGKLHEDGRAGTLQVADAIRAVARGKDLPILDDAEIRKLSALVDEWSSKLGDGISIVIVWDSASQAGLEVFANQIEGVFHKPKNAKGRKFDTLVTKSDDCSNERGIFVNATPEVAAGLTNIFKAIGLTSTAVTRNDTTMIIVRVCSVR